MERIRELDRYPKLLLLLLVVMAVGFCAVYGFVTSRVGFAYCDAILVPRTEGGVTLYEGTIDGADAMFTVGTDTVTFQLGSKTYGPYTAREDPTAVTDEGLLAVGSTGVEILEDGRPFFRGSVTELDGELMLLSGDGAPIVTSTATLSDGGRRREYRGCPRPRRRDHPPASPGTGAGTQGPLARLSGNAVFLRCDGGVHPLCR